MTKVTRGLTAKKPGSAPCPALVIDYGTTLLTVSVCLNDKCKKLPFIKHVRPIVNWHI